MESAFPDGFNTDSLDIVELIMEFEDEFEVSIPDEEYDRIRTVGDAIRAIKRRRASKPDK